jgi:hypothetical protein
MKVSTVNQGVLRYRSVFRRLLPRHGREFALHMAAPPLIGKGKGAIGLKVAMAGTPYA